MSRNSLVSGTVSITFASLIFMISGYLLNIWLGRFLGPHDYGSFGVVISLWSAANIFVTTGLPQAVSRYVSSFDDQQESILKSGLVLQFFACLLISLIYFFAAPYLALLFKDPSLTSQIRLSSMIFIPYGLYALYYGYFNGLHFFGYQAAINITYSVFKLIGAFVFVYFLHLQGIYIGYALAPLIAVLFILKIPKLSTPLYPISSLISFSLPITLTTVFTILQQSVDLFSIKTLLASSSQAGYYTAIQNIAFIPYYALGAISVVIFPGISREISGNSPQRVKEIITQSLRFTILVVTPMVILISQTSHFLTNLVFSEMYLEAAPSLSILVVAYGLFTVTRVLNNILYSGHYLKASVFSSLTGLFFSVIFCLAFVPPYGLNGAAAATVISSLISFVISAFFVIRRFKGFISTSTIARVTFASLLMYSFAVLIFRSYPVTVYSYPLIAAIYFFVLLLTGEFKPHDWHRLKSVVPAKVKLFSTK